LERSKGADTTLDIPADAPPINKSTATDCKLSLGLDIPLPLLCKLFHLPTNRKAGFNSIIDFFHTVHWNVHLNKTFSELEKLYSTTHLVHEKWKSHMCFVVSTTKNI
jgi:hypothetical protein